MFVLLYNTLLIFLLEIVLILGNGYQHTGIFQPKFAAPIVNLSIAIGREATFKCFVNHLGKYKVGWVKADTKAIQAIDMAVITHNSRISVSNEGQTVWKLHIRDVKEDDMGIYMCQINTDPMTSQVGHLNILIPPDFNPDLTSSDILTTEGSTIRLRCRANGRPEPNIVWKREDGKFIILRKDLSENSGLVNRWEEWGDIKIGGDDIKNYGGGKMFSTIKVQSYQGEILKFVKISRQDMGAYLCIASNGVPPTISKRIVVHVHFAPMVHVPNQLVGAPLNTYVSIECHIESYPNAISYWIHNTGEIISSNHKYDIQTITKSIFEVHLILTIKKLLIDDLGTYQCIAKNSLGEMQNNIRIYEIPGPTGQASVSESEKLDENFEKNEGYFENKESNFDIYNGVKIRHSKHANRIHFDSNWIPNTSKISKSSTYLEKHSSTNNTLHFEVDSNSNSTKLIYNINLILLVNIVYYKIFCY